MYMRISRGERPPGERSVALYPDVPKKLPVTGTGKTASTDNTLCAEEKASRPLRAAVER